MRLRRRPRRGRLPRREGRARRRRSRRAWRRPRRRRLSRASRATPPCRCRPWRGCGSRRATPRPGSRGQGAWGRAAA
ncbi:MAG: hypothetical protein FJ291_32515 [Planctomycetes bacterium]|nr:hypothetical protein [Planctomycetota bacterium]